MRDLANVVQALIAGAAKKLPAETGQTDRYKARFRDAGISTVILCDTSSSMDEQAGHRRKIEILKEALTDLWGSVPELTVVGFGSTVYRINDPSDVLHGSGGTALHLALDHAAPLRPRRTVVISDGRPDNEEAALASAEKVPGIIDVVYCGPDSDTQALVFMQRLARLGGGRVVVRDVVRDSRLRLAPAVRQVLGLPAPEVKP